MTPVQTSFAPLLVRCQQCSSQSLEKNKYLCEAFGVHVERHNPQYSMPSFAFAFFEDLMIVHFTHLLLFGFALKFSRTLSWSSLNEET